MAGRRGYRAHYSTAIRYPAPLPQQESWRAKWSLPAAMQLRRTGQGALTNNIPMPYGDRTGELDCSNAAMHDYGMPQVLPVSKRGTITLPPAYRRKLGLDRMENPLVLAEEKNGKLVLEVATAVPVRDIPESTIRAWTEEDEKAGEALRRKGILKQ